MQYVYTEDYYSAMTRNEIPNRLGGSTLKNFTRQKRPDKKG